MIPDPTGSSKGLKWQAKVTTWLINYAHKTWLQRNSERYAIDPETQMNAQREETEARIIKIYILADTQLTVYDHHELIKETLEERLLIPEPTNRIWAEQITRLIYLKIQQSANRPNLPDIRQFFKTTS